jgi:hypothetical protein
VGAISDIEVADYSNANDVFKCCALGARLPIAENTFCFELTPFLPMKKLLDRLARVALNSADFNTYAIAQLPDFNCASSCTERSNRAGLVLLNVKDRL